MAERFFLPQPVVGEQTTLDGDQAHHLARVMRAKPGDEVVLFDGQGSEYQAVIEDVAKKLVSLHIKSSAKTDDPNSPHITVACALPKGDRQKFLVEKLVELGANQLIPLKTNFSVAEANEKVIGRIEKQVIEACKQCRRNWLMKVSPESSIDSLLQSFESFAGQRLLADPYASSHDPLTQDKPCVIAIGPEGGFSDKEHQLFTDSEWQPVCFSPNVLRIETAAAAAVAIVRQSKFKKSKS